VQHTSKSFLGVSQRKGKYTGKAYENPAQLGDGTPEGPHDAEATERSASKREKNYARRERTCEPKERVWSKATPKNPERGQMQEGRRPE